MATKFDITPEARATQLAFLKRQLFRKSPAVTRSEIDLEGQTAIVTGSNTGIGLEASRQLLELGLSKLIIAVRSVAKGEAARDQLLEGRSTSKQSIEVWKLDLSDYDSILAFIERCNTLQQLHLVIHNAGLTKLKFELNPKTGHEEVVQVNYLSLVLLTIKLLPILQERNTAEDPGRIVLVNSETAAWTSFKEKDATSILSALDKEANYNAERYPTSKLLGQLFLSELIKHIPSKIAIVNASNPGLCYGSGLMSDLDGSIAGFVVGMLSRVIGRSTALGAQALTDASVRHGLDSHGHYIEDGKLQPMAPLVYSAEGQKIATKLWDETMQELSFAGVPDMVMKLSK